MFGDKDGTLCVAGRPVAAHLRARAPYLTRCVLDRLLAELPVYAELPQEEIAGDVADIVQYSLRQFADVLQRRSPIRPAELTVQRDSAAHRAEEGVPLDAILSAYQIGVAVGWAEIAAGVRPDDLDDFQEALGYLLDYQRQVIAAVSGAYLEARRILDSQDHGGRHALMTALLAGDRIDQVTRRTGLRPAERYLVLTLDFAAHPDEREPGQRAQVASRRKIRRVRTVLDRFAGEPALTALGSTGGTALLPVTDAPEWDRLRELVAEAADAADTPIIAAAEVAACHAVPEAVTTTAEVLEVVRFTGRPAGLYRLADVLLDYQLSRRSSALDGLAALLDPLAERAELLGTLRCYLGNALDRRRTGAELHIHPNTVSYRIRRICELTGLDPARPGDLQLLGAALIARHSRPGCRRLRYSRGGRGVRRARVPRRRGGRAGCR